MATVVASITGSLAASTAPLKRVHAGTNTVFGQVVHGGGTTISAGSGVTYLMHSKIPVNSRVTGVNARILGPGGGAYAVVLLQGTNEVTIATASVGAVNTVPNITGVVTTTTNSATNGWVYAALRVKPGTATTSAVGIMSITYEAL